MRLKDTGYINRYVLSESTSPDFAFKYIDISSVSSAGAIEIPVERTTFASAPSRARRLAPAGSTIVSTVRTYLRAVAHVPVAEEPLVFSTGFAVVEPRPTVDGRFLAYTCQSTCFIEEVVARSTGVSYPAINPGDLGAISVHLPPLDEQRRIADFLDSEISKIDRFRELRANTIRSWSERLAVVLDNRIRGQDLPNLTPADYAPLGAVPDSWGQARLRSVECDVQTGPFGSQLHAEDYIDGGWPIINPANIGPTGLLPDYSTTVSDEIRARLGRHVLEPGDVVFARRGELGRAAVVGEHQGGWLCGTGALRVRFSNDDFHPEYMQRYLAISAIRHYFEKYAVGSTMANLSTAILLGTPLLIPPPEAQESIVMACTWDEERHRGALTAFARQNALAAARRQELITAAVTEQIDVTTARTGAVA